MGEIDLFESFQPSIIFVQKEPREPIYLYEPGRDMGPMDMGFQPRGRGRGGFRGRGRGRGVCILTCRCVLLVSC